jgi:hypothetical protein
VQVPVSVRSVGSVGGSGVSTCWVYTSGLGMFPITILWSVWYGPTVTATVSLMHLAITFRYGYGSVHEPSTPIRYGRQRLYTVTVPLVNTYSTCKIYSLDPSYVSNSDVTARLGLKAPAWARLLKAQALS